MGGEVGGGGALKRGTMMVIREPRSAPGEVRVTEPPMSSMSCRGKERVS
jgi:hypothetical protein